MRVFEIADQVEALEKSTGTYYIGRLEGLMYDDIVNILGQPTFAAPSSDDKVQKEWVAEHCGDIFTIYDWCTYDEDYTMNNLNNWNIGGFSKNSLEDFKQHLRDEKTKNIYRADTYA